MTEEALNALRALARMPIEDLGDKDDDWPLFALNGVILTIGHVRDARAALTDLT